MKTKLIKCKDCEHKYRRTYKVKKDSHWCNIENQYNWKGKCKYFKQFQIRL